MFDATTEEIVHAAEVTRVERQILDLALERTASRGGAIFLWDDEAQALRVDFHVVDGVRISLPDLLLHKRTDGRPNGIAFHVAETCRSYLTNDTADDPYYAGYFLAVRSIAAAPIVYQDRAIGVISVSSRDTDAYTPAHLAELEALAASSAKFLRRAQLHRCAEDAGRSPLLIKGLSPEWLAAETLIEQVSPTNAPVLIRGESGTGKELVANAIHFNSHRARQPFVTINCAAIPETLLESTLFGHEQGAYTGADYARVGEFVKAEGGTLFLDEIGELSPILQAKLLRAIELGEIQPLGSNDPPRRVDVRVIAATNRPLEQMRAAGTFRDDLFFRVAVVTISVPPLRSYIEHLDVLCQVFVTQANRAYGKRVQGLAPDALALLRGHDFPGNMRELRNLVEHGVLVAQDELVRAADLPLAGALPAPRAVAARPTLAQLRKTWVAERERPYLVRLLEDLEGDVPAAAAALGVDRTTLYRLLKKHGIRLTKRVSWRADSEGQPRRRTQRGTP